MATEACGSENAASTKKKSGKYCVAWGCTSTYRDNVSLHLFPKESERPAVRRQWISFVRVKRKDFLRPSVHSVLCEKHFTSKCYPSEYELKQTMGISVKKKVLLPEAVPTIHVEPLQGKTTHKKTLPSESPDKNTKKAIPQSKSKHSFFSASPPKRMRSAYRKRESRRVLFEVDEKDIDDISPLASDIKEDQEQASGEEVKKSIGVQINGIKPPRRSKRTQIKPECRDKAIQTRKLKTRNKNAAVQCNILCQKSECCIEDDTYKENESDDGDREDDISMVDDEKDVDFAPELEHSTSSESTDNDSEDDGKSCTTDDRKYIVYEEN